MTKAPRDALTLFGNAFLKVSENPTSIALIKLLVKHSGSPKSLTCSTPLTSFIRLLNALSGKADVGWRTETYGPRSGSALFRWSPRRVSSHTHNLPNLTRSRSALR